MTAAGYSYRYAPLAGLDIPPAADWLGTVERLEYDRLRDAGRRRVWLAGRWQLKRLLAERLESFVDLEALKRLEIRSRDGSGRQVRPYAMVAFRSVKGRPFAEQKATLQPLDWSLSISHSSRGVLVAVAPPAMTIGVDLVEDRQTLGSGFEQVWFGRDERDWIIQQPHPRRITLWAAKEAAYKALNCGEPFVPRDLLVQPRPDGTLVCSRRSEPDSAPCRLTIWCTPDREIAVLATVS